MIYILIAPILKKQIQIGQTTTPLGLLLLFALCFVIVISLNGIYHRQYQRVLNYLKRNHPDIYESVRRKPDVGPFYSTGHNPSKQLIALSKQSHTLNDPQLEKMLLKFAQFDRKFVIFSTIAIFAMLLSILVVGLLLTT